MHGVFRLAGICPGFADDERQRGVGAGPRRRRQLADSAGSDPQRTSWVRTDAKISKDSLQKPGFQLLWKAKMDNQPRQLVLADAAVAAAEHHFVQGIQGARVRRRQQRQRLLDRLRPEQDVLEAPHRSASGVATRTVTRRACPGVPALAPTADRASSPGCDAASRRRPARDADAPASGAGGTVAAVASAAATATTTSTRSRAAAWCTC